MQNNVSDVKEDGPVGGAGTDGVGKGVGAEAGIGGISEDEGAAERGSQKMGEPLTSSPWPCKAL